MSLDQLKDDIISKVIGLVVAKTNYHKIIMVFTEAKLRLSKRNRKKLRGYVQASQKDNFLDLSGITNFLTSIDFANSRTLFNKHKDRSKFLGRKIKPYNPPPRAKVSVAEKLSAYRGTVKIGLGLQSNLKLSRVRTDDVVIDKNTDKKHKSDKSILYAAGWTIEGAFTKE